MAEPHRRRGDRPARPTCAAGSTRRAARSCSSASSSTRPSRSAPTPRATGRRSPWWPRSPPTWSCYLLDEPTSGLDPLMEAVFQDVVRGAARRRDGPCCSPATSSPRSRRCATGSPSSGRARRRDAAPSPSCATSPARRSWSRPHGRRPASPGWPGVHDAQHRGQPAAFSVDAADLNSVLERLVALRRAVAGQHPPTLEELFLRHYGDGHAGPRSRGCEPGAAPRRADFTGTRRLTRLAAAARPAHAPRLVVGLGLFVAATTAMFAQTSPCTPSSWRQTRMVATNAGHAAARPQLRAQRGRLHAAPRVPDPGRARRADEHLRGDPAHPPERGARPRRDARLHGRRSVRRPGRGRGRGRWRPTSSWPW